MKNLFCKKSPTASFFLITLIIFQLLTTSCGKSSSEEIITPSDDETVPPAILPSSFSSPLFPNAIVSNEIDFIHSDDPDNYSSTEFITRRDVEIPGLEGVPVLEAGRNAYIFEMSFTDGSKVPVWCHSSFTDVTAAQGFVEKLGPRYGKLPAVHRQNIRHVIILNGDRTAFAERVGHFFVLASENMDVRISNNDLEETVFHEAVHASVQDDYEMTQMWTRAIQADPTFITNHAENNPRVEDMPETAIFAYTLKNFPGRLPANVREYMDNHIPNKIAFFDVFYD